MSDPTLAEALADRSRRHNGEMYGCVECYRNEPCLDRTIQDAARERLEIESGNAILIRKDDDGNWPGWVETCGAYVRWENNRKSWAAQTVGEVLDFLLIALAEQADKAAAE